MKTITITLNGETVVETIEDHMTLGDFLRDRRNLTGTHLGCEHGVCGACTVLVDDEPIRSCITLAASLSGRAVRTIEGFEDDHGMEVVRECFSEAHGLQCGFCTAGMLLTVRDIVKRGCCGSAKEIRNELAGNLCRCTGYAGIVAAAEMARDRLKDAKK
ncbi:MAG: (2Fe-2S)-binding protein [Bradyrhizobium sp.]|nr:(2Fe-2S)-binding protein [Bradyrhizobium sp.]